ncbi:AAA family ATPase [Haloferula sp.]|uniref:AAA family ATPase n=1 Tax=Haloferula sp. TaxID=2497595 RepID=UPI00329D9508
MKGCHLVSGPPASGKTHYARQLAAEIGACLIDSDEVAERLVRAGMSLAGLDPDDRDSPAYKEAYREVVYETMYDLACSNLPAVPVVIAGPFTREGGDSGWLGSLEQRLGVKPTAHFVWCDPETRRRRIAARGEARDRPKLEAWDDYVASCREERPLWQHQFVDTSSL